MGGDQRDGGRALVDLAALDADEPVLDRGRCGRCPARRRGCSAATTRSKIDSGWPSSAVGMPSTKLIVTSSALTRGRRVVGVDEDVLRRLDPRVLEDTAFGGAAPEVLVDRVRRPLGHVDRQRRAPRRTRSPGHGSCRCRAPVRCTESSGASARMPTSKRTWSLPLPVQPCETMLGTVGARGGDEVLDDERPREC